MPVAMNCISINLIIGYGNKTVKCIITVKLLGVQIDDNISSVCICRSILACFAMVAVTGLVTADT